MWQRRVQSTLAALSLGVALPAVAAAEPVAISLELTVTRTFGDLRDLFGVPVSVGDTLGARMTYDSTAPDRAAAPGEGNYRFTGSLSFATASGLAMPNEDIWVFDDAVDPVLGTYDQFSAFAVTYAFSGFDAVQVELFLSGSGRTGDALPRSAGEFAAAFGSSGGLRLGGWQRGVSPPFDSGTHELGALVRVVSEPAPVPEPATVGLMAGGLAILARRRRRSRARKD